MFPQGAHACIYIYMNLNLILNVSIKLFCVFSHSFKNGARKTEINSFYFFNHVLPALADLINTL